METACKRDVVSCVSCCGIFNLVLGENKRNELLHKRTEEFYKYSKGERYAPLSYPLYRKNREEAERDIERYKKDIYVCPFLGFLRNEVTPGCLIHPSQTGNHRSQDFSFYGADICLGYDCKTKEGDPLLYYSTFLQQNFPNWNDYSRLMADYKFFFAFEKLRRGLFILPKAKETLNYLLNCRLLCNESLSITSFELDYEPIVSAKEKLLSLLSDSIGKRLPTSNHNIQKQNIIKKIDFLASL